MMLHNRRTCCVWIRKYRMRSSRLRVIIGISLLVAVCWMGYWLKYMSSGAKTEPRLRQPGGILVQPHSNSGRKANVGMVYPGGGHPKVMSVIIASGSNRQRNSAGKQQKLGARGQSHLGQGDLGKHDIGKPDVKPDIGQPYYRQPDTGKPDKRRPALGRPDLGQPDLGQPDLGQPDLGQPDLGQPDLGQPDLWQPDLEQPDLVQPDLAQPDLGQPDFGQPDGAPTDLDPLRRRLGGGGGERPPSHVYPADSVLGTPIGQVPIRKSALGAPLNFGDGSDRAGLQAGGILVHPGQVLDQSPQEQAQIRQDQSVDDGGVPGDPQLLETQQPVSDNNKVKKVSSLYSKRDRFQAQLQYFPSLKLPRDAQRAEGGAMEYPDSELGVAGDGADQAVDIVGADNRAPETGGQRQLPEAGGLVQPGSQLTENQAPQAVQPGNDIQRPFQPGNDLQRSFQPGNDLQRPFQPGRNIQQPGLLQAGNSLQHAFQPGMADARGQMQPGLTDATGQIAQGLQSRSQGEIYGGVPANLPLQPGLPQPGPPQPGPQQPGLPQPGPQQPGPQQPGLPQPWPQQPGLPQPGPQQPGLPQPGLLRPGPQQPGLPQPGPQQPGLPQPGLLRPGPQQPGLPQPGPLRPGPQQPGLPQPGPLRPGPQQPPHPAILYPQEVNPRLKPSESQFPQPIGAAAARLPKPIGALDTSMEAMFNGFPGASYVLIHNQLASRAPGDIHSQLKPLPDTVDPSAYILELDSLPQEKRLRPSIGNGYLATVVHSDEMFMSGLYNGRMEQSHRAVIPSTVSVRFENTEPMSQFTTSYRLDVAEGVYSEISSNKYYKVTQRIFAHRDVPHLMVVEFDLELRSFYPLKLLLDLKKWKIGYDLTFRQQSTDLPDVSYKKAVLSSPESEDSPYTEVHVIYDWVPDHLQPPDGALRTKWVFLTAVGNTEDQVMAAYAKGKQLIHSGDQLYGSHVRAWADLWAQGRVDAAGNLTVARAVYSSWYYLLSSIPLTSDPVSPFVGLSPCGLPLGDFGKDGQGHVTWDQEVWMSPALTLHQVALGRKLLVARARERSLRGAEKLALLHNQRGAMAFPWESGYSGLELATDQDPHRAAGYVSGFLSHTALQYLYASNDTTLLTADNYGTILTAIGRYYVGMLALDKISGHYVIKGVQPPDKFHMKVSNSAFTNGVASVALAAPEVALGMLGRLQTELHPYAENIFMPFDTAHNYHPEFDGYLMRSPIHQADVVLLGYPLQRPMAEDVRRNDLILYEQALDPQAPPTSWAMHAIGWLEVKEAAKAQEAFDRQFGFMRNGFQVWSDTTHSNFKVANYISGAGAFLQSITHGYGGFRVHKGRLELDPALPAGVTSLNFIGVDYLGCSLDIFVSEDRLGVQMTAQPARGPHLKVLVHKPEAVHRLVHDQILQLPRTRMSILAAHVALPEV